MHRDDLAADKVLAGWDRGEPRDYVDVDVAALLSVSWFLRWSQHGIRG